MPHKIEKKLEWPGRQKPYWWRPGLHLGNLEEYSYYRVDW